MLTSYSAFPTQNLEKLLMTFKFCIKNILSSPIQVSICSRNDCIRKIGKFIQSMKFKWKKNTKIFVSIFHPSVGTTMRFRTGQNLGLNACITSDIGIIPIISDLVFLLRVSLMLRDGKIVRALLHTMPESEHTKRSLQKTK